MAMQWHGVISMRVLGSALSFLEREDPLHPDVARPNLLAAAFDVPQPSQVRSSSPSYGQAEQKA